MAAKKHEHKLANGMSVCHPSKMVLDVLYREIFEERQYLRHGISLSDGACVFDVGANVGMFVLFLNQLLESGSVFAFEPIPRTFEYLQRNTERDNHLDLKLFECGMSKEPGVATFTFYPRVDVSSTMHPNDSPEHHQQCRDYIVEEMHTRGGLLKAVASYMPRFVLQWIVESVRRYQHKSEPVDCRLRTVSELIDEYQVKHIDLLKLDAESCEMPVLEGIRGEHFARIQQMVIEVHDGPAGVDRIVGFLQGHGYTTRAVPVMESVDHLQLVYARREE